MKLLESINNSCNETKLDQNSLDETFEMWWPKLEEKIKAILKQANNTTRPKKRSDRDIIEEILELTRSNAKSILSEQSRVSSFTIEELVSRYRVLKEKSSMGQGIFEDIIKMESPIIRLCKELNMDDITIRRAIYHPTGIRRFSETRGDKNSVMDGYPIRRKMSGEDTEGMKRKSE